MKRTNTWHARLPKARSQHLDPTYLAPICHQSQSIFFGRLPLEIRELVYANVGGDLIKLKMPDDEKHGKAPFKFSCPMLVEKIAFALSCKMA